MSTILVAVITALLTSLSTETLIMPRLEARKRRIQAAHESRDKFTSSIFDLLTYTARVQNLTLSSDIPEPVHGRLLAERQRWIDRIGQVTQDLVDDGITGTMTYPLWVGELAAQFALAVRMVWLSERSEASRMQLIHDLATHAHGFYATAVWRRPWQKPQHVAALRQVISDATENVR